MPRDLLFPSHRTFLQVFVHWMREQKSVLGFLYNVAQFADIALEPKPRAPSGMASRVSRACLLRKSVGNQVGGPCQQDVHEAYTNTVPRVARLVSMGSVFLKTC